MARQRVENSIKSWQEADEALLSIGQLDRKIETYEAEAQEEIENIKTIMVALVKPLQERKAALEMQLQAFCEGHKNEFKGKSRTLNFGTVSFRQSTKIVIRGVQSCIEALKSLGLTDFIRTKEAPDKDKMKDLDDATLSQVGAKRQPEDVFGYEVDRERVREAAGK